MAIFYYIYATYPIISHFHVDGILCMKHLRVECKNIFFTRLELLSSRHVTEPVAVGTRLHSEEHDNLIF